MRIEDFDRRYRLGRLLFLIALQLLLVSSLHAQARTYSDDQLIAIGQDEYQKGDYIAASLFLFAYIQKSPQKMSANPTFTTQVQDSYQFSLDEVRGAWSERDQLKAQAKTQSQGGQVTAGLSRQKPRLDIPQ